ncbi:MAG: M48 family metalloprotease, partial [Aquificaceae bacterium]
MHEYPLLFFFLVFVVAILLAEKSLLVLTFVFFMLGLFAHRFFSLFLKRLEWEHYDKVFILPFGNNAYAVGNSILVGKSLLNEDKEIVDAILMHELGHIRYRDFLTTFLFLVFLKLSTRFVERKETLLFTLLFGMLFVWTYWHMEVRADMFAKAQGKNIEKALERFSLRWRLAFVRGQELGDFQEKA